MTMMESNAGTLANCDRCKELVKVAERPRNEEARMLRLATEPKGLCACCAVTEWFTVTGFREMHGDILPKGLLSPNVQKQFLTVMKSAGADMKPDEINWERVVKHWDLPFSGHKKARKGRRL